MNPEAQRIAIAKACGWALEDLPDHQNGPKQLWKDPTSKQYSLPPFYYSDLNAMHEAERVLRKDQVLGYVFRLSRVVLPHGTSYDGSLEVSLFHATAAQRAEAFLKTLNLWTDK